MENSGKITALMQKAVNVLNDSEKWCNQAFMQAQLLGLQGEKRRERHEARKGYMLIQYIQSLSIDLFDHIITAQDSTVKIQGTKDIPSYFNMYLNKLETEYNELHTIANDMVVANYRIIAEQIYCYTDCLFKEIIDTKRAIKECTLAKWEYHHVSRYQVSMKENVHDIYEKKERKDGYDY